MSNRLIEKQVIFDGQKIRLEIHHLEDADGKRIRREVCVHNGAVVILPFVDQERILLLRNRRYAVGQLLYELPAGTLEKGENPMNCAGRELEEETGYVAGRLKPIGKFYSSPGILTEKMFAFAAFDLKKSKPALEEGEEIEVTDISFQQALEMIRHGEIEDAKTICALLMFERFTRNS